MPSSRSVITAAPETGKTGREDSSLEISGVEKAALEDAAQELRAQAARNHAAEHRRITSRLRQALEQNDFTLLYQLQTSLKSDSVRGAEASVCLRHRRRGLIPPSHFMPVAERSDIAIEIGNWGIMQACRDAALLKRDFFMSVQVSHRQLLTGRLVKQVIEALSAFDLTASRMEFGVTEAMLIDENDDVNFALRALRGLGVGLVLDNFGTSYASLSLLKRVPLTLLKLDRSMIAGLPGARENTAILRATIHTAHALGIRVIADGVEAETQYRILGDLGCDFAQSPHINPPMPFEALTEKLT